ncbi:MAG: alpha-amylase family glycosyl hydrolase [Rubrivivax sp.]
MSRDWWRGATLYQIYPRSFADANGDGVGDLAGATAKLPYVAGLGVDGIWLSPFFTSPMRDFGYDVADHLDVDPLFGTGTDFDALLAEAHRLGLKVVIDQVWSHTAAEHPWFQESCASRDNAKADWYVWADAKPDGSPPNNWQSWMGGPAWRWEPRRRQYHLHNFLPQMPDLNFHCAAVQDAVLEIARHWLERGVDGFRLDTANLYFHSRDLRDNPPMPEGQRGDAPVLMQQHVHNADQPEAPAFFERLRALMDRCGAGGMSGMVGMPRMAVAEIGGAEPLPTMVAYTQGAQRLHTAYSFAFLGERPDAAQVLRCLAPWAQGAGRQAWPSWAFSNHDAPRVASRWGRGAAGAFAFGGGTEAGPANAGATPVTWLALLLALRGTVFLYQGEELGLPQSTLAFEDLRDPYGLAHWPLNPGRDGCRTPFPWQADAPQLGFSHAARTWLPVDPAHAPLAVDRQEADPASTLHATRRLLALRRAHPALRLGDLDALVGEGDVLVLRRQHTDARGTDALLLAFNLGASSATLALPAAVACGAAPLFVHGGATLHGAQLHLPPGAVMVAPLA